MATLLHELSEITSEFEKKGIEVGRPQDLADIARLQNDETSWYVWQGNNKTIKTNRPASWNFAFVDESQTIARWKAG